MRQWIAALIVGLAGTPHALANKPLIIGEEKVVGTAQIVTLMPRMAKAERRAGRYVLTERVAFAGASFLKAHFVDVNLRAGDRIVLINALGRVVEEITAQGPKDRGNFWALSAQGDSLVVRLEFTRPYAKAPFSIDRVITGDADFMKPRVDSGERSICSPGDFQDAVCFAGDSGKWSNVRASVGVMTVGGNATTAVYCSGSNVSASNRVLTNHHCVSDQAECDNAEFVFEFYANECNVPGAAISNWQSYRCDTVLATQPLGDCDAGPGDLDFSLSTVVGDPAGLYGHAQIDPTPLASGEGLYIVQHADGRPHEITLGSGADVEVDGSVLRYYDTLDTESGSSGSPVFREADDKIVGLHHCGGCSTPGTGNRGMLMSDIFPLISEFLCTESIQLDILPSGGLTEVAGNGSASVDPGEQWSYTFAVHNRSCAATASNVSAEISVAGGDAVLATTTISLGDIPAGATVISAPVVFSLPSDAPCHQSNVFDVVALADGDGNGYPGLAANFQVTTGEQVDTIVYSESFDAGLSAWSIVDGGTGSGAAATWSTANPGARTLTLTAPYAIVDSDALGTGQTMDEELISPVIDTTGFDTITLSFTHDFNHYVNGNDEQGDVEIRSIATLGQWVALANFSGGDSSGTASFDITPYAGVDTQMRFHYHNAVYEWWWAIDDVRIVGRRTAVCEVFGSDSDGDGVTDDADNCTLIANPDQTDSNADGYGNACDADLNDDGDVNPTDLGLLRAVFLTADADADFNGDGVVNPTDLSIMRSQFLGPPGPSGLVP